MFSERHGMFSFILSTLICAQTFWAPELIGAEPSAADFLPIVLGGTPDIKEPGKVHADNNKVEAASAQDAINAGVRQLEEQINPGDELTGAVLLKFPSGIGYLATGAAAYSELPNPTATRIAQRKAYVAAFTVAKKELAETLGGLTNEAKDTLRRELTNVTLADDEMTNIKELSDESLKQTVDMMLRGFVIYSVKDNPEEKLVYVSIVTTPRTRGQLSRPTPNVVEVDDLRNGINQVLSEVKSEVVPPVGGRIIVMKSTGETAFVGFGSSIVRSSKTAGVQAQWRLESQKIAAARAKDSLCGLIIGDRTVWQGQVVEKLRDETREYDDLTNGDPLASVDPKAFRKLDQSRTQFVATIEKTDLYESARQGRLPPGITTKTWFDEDGVWAFGMSVYVPSLTDAAAGAALEMRDSKLLRDPKTKGSGSPGQAEQKEKTAPTKVKPGPTGKVGKDDDL